MANIGFGDGIVFRLAQDLKHRVTEVEGTVPKIAFAGWFHSQPDFYRELRKASGTVSFGMLSWLLN